LSALFWLLTALASAHPGGHDRVAEVEARMEGDCPAAGLLTRAAIYRQMDHTAEAQADFDAARRCDPELEGLDIEEARLHLDLDAPARAQELLERHVSRVDGDAGWVLLAQAHMAQQAFAEADTAFARALGDDVGASPDHVLSWAEARERSGRVAAALEVIERGLEPMSGSPALQDRAVELEVALGRYDEALARLDVRLQAMPTLLATWVQRGDALVEAGRCPEAKASYGEVLTRWETLPSRLQNRRMAAVRDEAKRKMEAGPCGRR